MGRVGSNVLSEWVGHYNNGDDDNEDYIHHTSNSSGNSRQSSRPSSRSSKRSKTSFYEQEQAPSRTSSQRSIYEERDPYQFADDDYLC